MEISNRSKLSLVQLLLTMDQSAAALLLNKHLGVYPSQGEGFPSEEMKGAILNAANEQIGHLCEEFVRTNDAISRIIQPRYLFTTHWEDFKRCMFLDGWLVDDAHVASERRIIPIDESVGDQNIIQDELTSEIRRTNISNKEEILRTLENSANAFLRNPPDYNGCLAVNDLLKIPPYGHQNSTLWV